MIKMVLRDYREGFRWSRLQKTYQFNMIWLYVYFLTIFPILMRLNEKSGRMVRYYTFAMPLLFGLYTMSAIPIRLPKQMFLCPLSEGERESYVKTLFMVRLIIPIVLGVTVYGLAVIFGAAEPALLWVQFFGMASVMLNSSITNWPGSTWERDEKKKSRLKNPKLKGLYGISLTGLLAAMFFAMIPMIGWDGEIDLFFGIIMILLGITAIICDALVLRYFKPMIEMTIDYETSYDGMNREQKA